MGEPAVCLGAVPVFYFRRDHDHGSRFEAYRGFALFLIPAASGGADEDLAAACLRVMDMPVVAAARLKCDICQSDAALARFSQRV